MAAQGDQIIVDANSLLLGRSIHSSLLEWWYNLGDHVKVHHW